MCSFIFDFKSVSFSCSFRLKCGIFFSSFATLTLCAALLFILCLVYNKVESSLFSNTAGFPLMDLMYSVKSRFEKKGVAASNQEDVLRPAQPQAISCVPAVRQNG